MRVVTLTAAQGGSMKVFEKFNTKQANIHEEWSTGKVKGSL